MSGFKTPISESYNELNIINKTLKLQSSIESDHESLSFNQIPINQNELINKPIKGMPTNYKKVFFK